LSANIRAFPDAGIIYAIEDNIGPDGYADVTQVADVLGLENAKGLGVRLGWMKRYGMVVSHRRDPGRWRPTARAQRVVHSPAVEVIQTARSVELDVMRRTVQHYHLKRKAASR
jgi:hypothetical protein